MEKNRNLILGGLVVLLVMCSIWGSVNNRAAKSLQLDLTAATAELDALKAEKPPVPVEPKIVTVEDPRVKELEAQLVALQGKKHTDTNQDMQLKKARQELVQIRKANKRFEAQIAQQNAVITNLQEAVEAKTKQDAAVAEEANALRQQLAQSQEEGVAAGQKMNELIAANEKTIQEKEKLQADIVTLQAEISAAQEIVAAIQEKETVAAEKEKEQVARLTVDMEMALAQIVGLEKIVEEKNAALEETSLELDRVKINMDVLLGKISDQQDVLQELEQENAELIRDVTDKNDQLADLQDQLQQTPLQD